ncbi:MAG: 3-dehydroquinate synthase [Clostridiales bacterium]|nr:3-dehydroquinate synthase [Clostridiales bacterium]
MQLSQIGKALQPLMKSKTVVIVTDQNVEKLYLPLLQQSLIKEGFVSHSFVIVPGESSKTPEVYLQLIDFMAQIPLTRADGVIALGGGVVGDLAGFAAATYLRGIPLIHIPTTLLAMVDSSIGGKTGVNLSQGKNLLGAFYQPLLLWQDDTLLHTLPHDVFLDGMGEVIKYAMIADPSLFALLQKKNAMERHQKEIVSTCIAIKQAIVKEDERDLGIRQLLNFGHTIGHAIEKASHYSIGHGSAVALGMDLITNISQQKGWCDSKTYTALHELLLSYGFVLSFEALFPKHRSPESLVELKKQLVHFMFMDKKRTGRHLTLIVPRTIGRCEMKQISIDELEGLL